MRTVLTRLPGWQRPINIYLFSAYGAMLPPEPSAYQAVVFGETFCGAPCADYHSLQYKFKPQSAGRRRPGTLQLRFNTVALQLPNAAEGQQSIGFEGKWAPSQPGSDCIAIFDGGQWRLELLHGCATNIRHFTAHARPETNHSGSPDAIVKADFSEDSGVAVPPRDTHEGEGHGHQQPGSQMLEKLPPSSTPSLTMQDSVTPSLSRQPSPEASPPSGHEATGGRTEQLAARLEVPGMGRSPSVRQPTTSPEPSLTSSSSESEGEADVQGRSTGQEALPRQVPAGEVQDFEREFFENDMEDESDHDGSESSGNQSEEEAKHF